MASNPIEKALRGIRSAEVGDEQVRTDYERKFNDPARRNIINALSFSQDKAGTRDAGHRRLIRGAVLMMLTYENLAVGEARRQKQGLRAETDSQLKTRIKNVADQRMAPARRNSFSSEEGEIDPNTLPPPPPPPEGRNDINGSLAEYLQRHLEQRFGVIVVDENDSTDKSGDRGAVNRRQATILDIAGRLDMPVFLTKMGAMELGETSDVEGYNDNLDDHVPKRTRKVYRKSNYTSDAFAGNEQLCKDVRAARLDAVVVMGQNENACVKATSKGAADLGLEIHTSEELIRGGNLHTVGINEVLWEHGGPQLYYVHTRA